MSAFIVGAACINSIVAYLGGHADRFCWLNRDLGYDVSQPKDLHRLAGALHALNCEAVDQRYGRGTAAGDTASAPPFEYRPVIRDGVGVYKAILCLLYQCSEGDVPETPLYKALENMGNVIADDVVSGLPAFETASWGD